MRINPVPRTEEERAEVTEQVTSVLSYLTTSELVTLKYRIEKELNRKKGLDPNRNVDTTTT